MEDVPLESRATRRPAVVRDPALLFAPPRVSVERRADGSSVLRSPEPLGPIGRAIGESLERWAAEAPDRPFLKERGPDGAWVGPTYAEARELVWRIATWLVGHGLDGDRPIAILSDNGVEHALLTLAAMHVGVSAAPVSPAYSLLSSDFAKLGSILDQTRPGLIYVSDHRRYGPALAATGAGGRATVVSGSATDDDPDVVPFARLTRSLNPSAVAERFAATGPDTVAKLLFTVSYGTSSYGYDIRCAREFKVFTNIYSTVVDPKQFDERSFVDIEADTCLIPPNSFALARTMEYFRIPRNVLTICLGKSTYARCGIIVNVTPFEPEWEGYVTLEFSNTTPLPARIYAGEGCAQVLFFESDEVCETSYRDRGGKYQGQRGVTLPKA
jgi:dCTP deaminase